MSKADFGQSAAAAGSVKAAAAPPVATVTSLRNLRRAGSALVRVWRFEFLLNTGISLRWRVERWLREKESQCDRILPRNFLVRSSFGFLKKAAGSPTSRISPWSM